MPTFMLDSGRLAPVAHPGIVPDGFTDEWSELVRRDVLDLTGCAAFPIAWDGGSPPLLSAMRADGAGLGAAVLPRLDLVTLAELLARAGQVATQSWAELAGQYPGGTGAFRRDWNVFREARALPSPQLPALVVVTGSASAQVRQALPLLGRVQILLAQVRRSQTGAQLLDVEPLPAGATPGTPDAGTGGAGRRATGTADAEHPRRRSTAAAGSVRTPARGRTAASAPTPVRPTGTGCPDLKQVAAMVRAPVPIEYHHGGTRQQAVLRPDGRVVFPDGSEYTDLTRASTGMGGTEPPDPWQAWRFIDGQFPLAEARTEARRVLPRTNGARPPQAPGRGRRARA